MKRRVVLITISLVAALLPLSAAGARPPDHAQERVPPHADIDRNGLADSLEAVIADRGPHATLDVVVTWSGGVDLPAARAAAGTFTVLREFTIIDGFHARMTGAQARAVAHVPGVFRVEPNFVVEATNEDADLDYGTHQARIDTGRNGSSVDVCVLDTGADPGHEQLDGGKVKGFADLINGRTSAYDDHGHGTHVAATIAGDGTGSADAARFQGVAPGAGIFAAKVLSGAGSGTEAQIIAGIEWCVDDTSAQILSMSLGTSTGSDGLDALSLAVNNAVAAGLVAAVAAGNSGDGPQTVGSPGAAIDALTVGAASKFGAGLHLAPFSSRGPNLAGVLKPDVTAPGVAIWSADAGTSSGYFAASGTSMATPFVAGTVALALDRDPTLSPAAVKTLVTSTARDLGVAGPDGDWGHGLLDGYAVAAGSGSGGLPGHTSISASVAKDGLWSHAIAIAGDDVGRPLGITLLIDGAPKCSLRFYGLCLLWEWSPDLDARLIAPDGSVTNSRCPLEGNCGATGVQETFTVAAAMAGTYTLEVYPFADRPNNGQGGPFNVDIFTGDAGAAPPPPPPPPGNQPPVADAGSDQTVSDSDGQPGESVTLDGSSSSDPDGSIVSWVWTEGGTEIGNGETATVAFGDGVHNVTLTVTDNEGATAQDTVVITVEGPAPPPPPPGGDPHIGDLDGVAINLKKGEWRAEVTVTVHNGDETPLAGVTVTFVADTFAACTTGADGTCTLISGNLRKKTGSVTFTLLGASPLPFDPALNHDPDGDSDGTTITVLKP